MNHTTSTELEALDTCAFEGCAEHEPTGRPFTGLHPRSRVWRDDMPDPWAIGWHLFLQSLGAVMAVLLPTLALLYAFGVLPPQDTRPLPRGVITMATPEVRA